MNLLPLTELEVREVARPALDWTHFSDGPVSSEASYEVKRGQWTLHASLGIAHLSGDGVGRLSVEEAELLADALERIHEPRPAVRNLLERCKTFVQAGGGGL